MKKFAGNKSREQVKAQCKALGLVFDEAAYKAGSDVTRICGGGASVCWISFNGRFFGPTDTGVEFSSDSTKHEDEPWFQALLSFFYVEKEPAHV
jgi:hypothetical protein